MHTTTIEQWRHSHDFGGSFEHAESKTRRVLGLTAIMMVGEIVGGLKLHSMALFANGWHMGTHVAAFFITVAAYSFVRRLRAAFNLRRSKLGIRCSPVHDCYP